MSDFVKMGVWGSRVWHWTTVQSMWHKTLCGQFVNSEWRTRSRDPGFCAKCERIKADHTEGGF